MCTTTQTFRAWKFAVDLPWNLPPSPGDIIDIIDGTTSTSKGNNNNNNDDTAGASAAAETIGRPSSPQQKEISLFQI